jgi:hypothetical protein
LILGDLDGDGRDEIVVDFGADSGLWAWVNDSFWIQVNRLSPEGLATGHLNLP